MCIEGIILPDSCRGGEDGEVGVVGGCGSWRGTLDVEGRKEDLELKLRRFRDEFEVRLRLFTVIEEVPDTVNGSMVCILSSFLI